MLFTFLSSVECQTGYQTPKTNKRQQEQVGIICMESCYWQSLGTDWLKEQSGVNQSQKTTAFQTESKQILGNLRFKTK